MHLIRIPLLLVFVLANSLTACGGGGSSTGSDEISVNPQTSSDDGNVSIRSLSGTVSAGAKDLPPEATVELKSINGTVSNAAVAAGGQFEFSNVPNDGPYLLRVNTGDGQIFYTIAPTTADLATNRNMHAYSDFAARNWFATSGMVIEDEFDSGQPLSALPTAEEYTELTNEIEGIVSGVLTAYDLDNVDIMVAPFSTDGTTIDRFLRANPLSISDDTVTLTITDPVSMTESTLLGNNASRVTIDTVLTNAVDNPPQTPLNIRVLAAGDDEVVVLWDPSNDDRGVASYRVFRDGMLVGSSPFPLYSDTGLEPATDYSYRIESVDSGGQMSNPSAAGSGQTASLPDNTAPPTPVSVSAAAESRIITVDWVQVEIGDVSQFSVTRTTTDQTLVRQVTATSFDDLNVTPGTEYCYSVASIDGAGNISANSTISCATVSQPGTQQPGTTPTMPDLSDPIISLADCGSIPVTQNQRSNDVDLPVAFDVATLVSGSVDPSTQSDSQNFWTINLRPGGYHLVVDLVRTAGLSNSLRVTTLNSLGVEQERILRISGSSLFGRGVVFITVESETTLRLQIESERFSGAADYWMGVFPNGSSIPSPRLINCPTTVSLQPGNTESLTLDTSRESYFLVDSSDLPANLIIDVVRENGVSTNVNVQARFQFAQNSTNQALGRISGTDAAERFAVEIRSFENSDFAWIRLYNDRFSGDVSIEARIDPL